MDRRNSLKAIAAAGTVLLPLELLAQARPGNRPFRIGFLAKYSSAVLGRFVANMRELGWREGQDFFLVDSGIPFEPTQVEEGVRLLLLEKPDLIVVFSTDQAVAAHRQTKTIPIVMFASGHPVDEGLANSLARPGKNVTGVSLYVDRATWGKLLELLRDSKPGIKRVGILWSYEVNAPSLRVLGQAGAKLGIATDVVQVAGDANVPSALETISAGRPDALIVTSGMGAWKSWPQVMQFAIDRKLPTITEMPQASSDKHPLPLLMYGPNLESLRRARYSYIDRILKGASPGDLPIQLPSRFELVVSLKTAKSIGLKLPQSLLARADRVID